MTFTESIKTVYSKYATFSGRAMRSEFWWYMLFSTLVGVVLDFIPLAGDLWSIANMVPTLAVSARRLHDIDRSGWWQVLPVVSAPFLIPGIYSDGMELLVIGGGIAVATVILLIVWFATPGTQGPNRFGDDPKGAIDAEIFG